MNKTQQRGNEARCSARTAAPHKQAELYRLPDKFDDMNKVRRGEWHLTAAWTQETARLVAMIHAITGGEGEIVVSFPAYLPHNVQRNRELCLFVFLLKLMVTDSTGTVLTCS